MMSTMLDSHFSSCYSLQEHMLTLTIAVYRVTDYFPKSEILRNDLRAKANEIFQQMTEYDTDVQHTTEIELLIRKVGTMKGYLKIASTLQYVRLLNFTILEKEYNLIGQFLENEKVRHTMQSIHEDIKNLKHSSLLYPQAKKDIGNLKQEREGRERKGNYNNSLSHKIENSKGGNIHSETKPLDVGFHRRTDGGLNERQKIIMDYLTKSGQGKISDFYTSLKGVSSKTIQRDLQYLVDKKILKKEGEKRWTVYVVNASTA